MNLSGLSAVYPSINRQRASRPRSRNSDTML